MKPGSKYYPLLDYLQRCGEEQTTLSFARVETLLGIALPPSARRRQNWWSNRDSPSALQAAAWIGAGYQVVAVDLAQERVTFSQFHRQYRIHHRDGKILWHQDAIRALRKHMSLTQTEFAEQLGVRRQTVSEWENGVYDPDRSKAKFLELIAQQANFNVPADGSDE
jgi:DNA-binding transcriptional regulator YiaG